MKMKLWILTLRADAVGGKGRSVVVRAATEERAREVVNPFHDEIGEHGSMWTFPDAATCKRLRGRDGDSGVVLRGRVNIG